MNDLTDERVRNYLAWCSDRVGMLSGADIGRALANAWLEGQSDLEKARAEIVRLTRLNTKRVRVSDPSKHGTICACLFDDEDNNVAQCGHHADLQNEHEAELASLRASLAAMEGENKRIEAQLAGLVEFNATAREGEPLRVDAQFKGEAIKAWASAMVDCFKEGGATNYLTCELIDSRTRERYEVTMQKCGGKTAAQALTEANAEIARLQAALSGETHGK